MAASATQNPAVKTESKSAKKKKAKNASGETEASTASTSTPAVEVAPSNAATESNNGDGVYESPYVKELQK